MKQKKLHLYSISSNRQMWHFGKDYNSKLSHQIIGHERNDYEPIISAHEKILQAQQEQGQEYVYIKTRIIIGGKK